MAEAVIITGASSGIGKAAAEYLGKRGYHVYAGVRTDPGGWGTGVEPVRLDVTSDESVRAAFAGIAAGLGRAKKVHLLNNAGIALGGPVEAVPVARWEEQFAVNVFGLVRVTQAALPYVRAAGGRIVNVSSVSGFLASPYLGPYAASKHAVEALSDALRRELRQFGVQVIVVEPGPVATPIWEKGLARESALTKGTDPAVTALYRRELDRFLAGVKDAAAKAVNAGEVAEVIHRALSARRPRTRYVVGGQGASLARLLPDRWLDALVAREMK